MTTTRRKLKASIAALLIYSTLQLAGQAALAEVGSTSPTVSLPQQLLGRLITRNNKPVLVNGLSAATGASIATGATIETKADEWATVQVGPLGRLEISPNTQVTLTFDASGEMKAVVNSGCVTLTTLKNTRGEVLTPQGSAGTTDPATKGVIDTCKRSPAAVPTAGGLFGMGWTATIAFFTSGTLMALPLFFQDNPSPT
jgi:hypothetical protein